MPAGTSLSVTSDSYGGNEITNIDPKIAGINGANSLTTGTETLSLACNIELAGLALPTINLHSAVAFDIIGNCRTVDGGGGLKGLFVKAGAVSIRNLALNDMQALGGNGWRRRGVRWRPFGAASTVTLAGVSFAGDAALGGNGGSGSSGGGGTNASAGGRWRPDHVEARKRGRFWRRRRRLVRGPRLWRRATPPSGSRHWSAVASVGAAISPSSRGHPRSWDRNVRPGQRRRRQ